MYFAESERLKSELPELAKEIGKLDSLIFETTRHSELCVSISYLVGRLRCDRYDAGVLLDRLVDFGALKRVFTTVCPTTRAGIHRYADRSEVPDRYSCDLCLETHELDEKSVVVQYIAPLGRPAQAEGAGPPPFDLGDGSAQRPSPPGEPKPTAPETGAGAQAKFDPEFDSLVAYRATPNGAARLEPGQAPTVGVVTALKHEMSALESMLDDAVEEVAEGVSGGVFTRGTIPAVGGKKHRVVAVQLSTMGNNSAAISGSRIIAIYGLKHLVMVGIAGGVPSPKSHEDHVRLGDVVLLGREGVKQYDLGKQTSEGLQPRANPRPPGRKLLEAVERLMKDEIEGRRPWMAYFSRTKMQHCERPAGELDVIHDSDDKSLALPHPDDPSRLAGTPRLFSGAIGSGNIVVKDARTRDRVKAQFGVKAIEMEGSGIADAAWFDSCELMVVRGVCDYCDEHKNDSWQRYAALAAAAVFRGLLERCEPLA